MQPQRLSTKLDVGNQILLESIRNPGINVISVPILAFSVSGPRSHAPTWGCHWSLVAQVFDIVCLTSGPLLLAACTRAEAILFRVGQDWTHFVKSETEDHLYG